MKYCWPIILEICNYEDVFYTVGGITHRQVANKSYVLDKSHLINKISFDMYMFRIDLSYANLCLSHSIGSDVQSICQLRAY